MKLFKNKNTDCHSKPAGRGIHGRKIRPLNQTNQRGRSMVEMLGVLAVIGVLSVGGVAGYRYAIEQAAINETLNFLNKVKLGYLIESGKEDSILYTPTDRSYLSSDKPPVLSIPHSEYFCKNYIGDCYIEGPWLKIKNVPYAFGINPMFSKQVKGALMVELAFGKMTLKACSSIIKAICNTPEFYHNLWKFGSNLDLFSCASEDIDNFCQRSIAPNFACQLHFPNGQKTFESDLEEIK